MHFHRFVLGGVGLIQNGRPVILPSLTPRPTPSPTPTQPIHTPRDVIQLHEAARKGNSHTIDKLLRQGCDVNFASDVTNRTALHYAALHGNFDVAKVLVEKGARLDIRLVDNEKVKYWRGSAAIPLKPA